MKYDHFVKKLLACLDCIVSGTLAILFACLFYGSLFNFSKSVLYVDGYYSFKMLMLVLVLVGVFSYYYFRDRFMTSFTFLYENTRVINAEYRVIQSSKQQLERV